MSRPEGLRPPGGGWNPPPGALAFRVGSYRPESYAQAQNLRRPGGGWNPPPGGLVLGPALRFRELSLSPEAYGPRVEGGTLPPGPWLSGLRLSCDVIRESLRSAPWELVPTSLTGGFPNTSPSHAKRASWLRQRPPLARAIRLASLLVTGEPVEVEAGEAQLAGPTRRTQ